MATMSPPYFFQLLARLCVVALSAALSLTLAGCRDRPAHDAAPDVTLRELEPAIPLPQLGPDPLADAPSQPLFHATVQRIDIPLDQSADEAWAVIDEQTFPAMTRGVWHANGLRIGVLDEAGVEAFAAAMPQVLELFQTQVFTSQHPVPVLATPRLHDDLRIPVDLTIPPAPPQQEMIKGGGSGRLQILAQIEQDGGKTFLVLTPHHYLPGNHHLLPRDILERELDGRLYHDLSVRVQLTDDRLLVVGLYWPWPLEEQDRGHEAATAHLPEVDITWLAHAKTSANLNDDPAAPPAHLRLGIPERPETDPAPETNDGLDTRAQEDATPARYTRVAPALPAHFGRTLFTGTRARKPIQSLLLISTSQPPQPAPAQPAEAETGQPE